MLLEIVGKSYSRVPLGSICGQLLGTAKASTALTRASRASDQCAGKYDLEPDDCSKA
jgi:hypothetical protein